MDASIDNAAPLALVGPGRFTKIAIHTSAGAVEARLSEGGNWELRVRKEDETNWRIACRGDLNTGAVLADPVRREALVRGPLVVDLECRTVSVDGVTLRLAGKEYSLLAVLAARPDRVFTKEELLSKLWGYAGEASTRTVDSHVTRLRRKLRAAGAEGLIVTCYGVGYRLWDRADLARFPRPQQVNAAA